MSSRFGHIIRNLLFAAVLLAALSIMYCSRANAIQIPSSIKNNWRAYLTRARNGTGDVSNSKALDTKGILNFLRLFLIQKHDRIYKNDEVQWLYDQAMIQLMASEFISSFNGFKTYTKQSRDDVRPWLHVGLRIARNDSSLRYYFLNTAISNASFNSHYSFAIDEEIFLLNTTPDHFCAVMPESAISQEVRSSNVYIKYEVSRQIQKDISELSSRELIEKYYDLAFPLWYIAQVSDDSPSDDQIALVFRYYLLFCDYEKAYEIAMKFGVDKFIKLGSNSIQYFYKSILEIMFSLGKYQELLTLFEKNQFNKWIIYFERTFCSGYYWVASAYAMLEEYDNALEYLKRAFDVTTLRNQMDQVDITEMNTLSLIWHVVMSEAFDKFREVGRYNEVEEIMEAELAKYKHLDWFAAN